jgi:hypothetical protein
MGEMSKPTYDFQMHIPGGPDGRSVIASLQHIAGFRVEVSWRGIPTVTFPAPFEDLTIEHRTGYEDGPEWDSVRLLRLGQALAHFGAKEM